MVLKTNLKDLNRVGTDVSLQAVTKMVFLEQSKT
jgi:hypothetical protein